MAQLTDDCFAFGDALLPYHDALDHIKTYYTPSHNIMAIPLNDACYHVAAHNVLARYDVPSFDNAAVDGYAVHYDDITEPNQQLPVQHIILAGSQKNEPLKRGHAIKIMTGARMPKGANMVYMIEDCQEHYSNPTTSRAPPIISHVTIPHGLKVFSNYRNIGDDIHKKQPIITQGQVIKPYHIGLSAAQHYNEINCYKKLNVAILSTGDEIGQDIIDSNKPMLRALCNQWGYNVIDAGHAYDTCESIIQQLNHVQEHADIIITSGGASTGDGDLLKDIMHHIDFWRVAIKPGRPLGAGYFNETPLLMLPGNPVAAFTCMVMIGRFMLQHLQGAIIKHDVTQLCKANFNYRKKLGRREFVRVTIGEDNGQYWVQKYGKSGAGVLSSLQGADGFAILHEHLDAISIGDDIEYIDFRMMGV